MANNSNARGRFKNSPKPSTVGNLSKYRKAGIIDNVYSSRYTGTTHGKGEEASEDAIRPIDVSGNKI
mgnify:CR=1 FL=1